MTTLPAVACRPGKHGVPAAGRFTETCYYSTAYWVFPPVQLSWPVENADSQIQPRVLQKDLMVAAIEQVSATSPTHFTGFAV